LSILIEFECNLSELKSFANNLATDTNISDIYLLSGDLGVGKTTFTRFFINALFDKYKINKPKNIKSPSYPILINYPLLNFEIYHYDLYRLKNKKELFELGFFENFNKNISLIEWPEIIINDFNLTNYHLINLKFIDLNKRQIKHQYFKFNVS
tara:strand:- start:452 stop:910 length:459 start_codon:yes stop_codon:yes gene_type:complete